jgi:hypothetical protein
LFKKYKDVTILGVDVIMNSVIIAVNNGFKIIDVIILKMPKEIIIIFEMPKEIIIFEIPT